jgi:hypothetical protein
MHRFFAVFLFCLLAVVCQAQWLISEGFEASTLPAGWLAVDSDGDGRAWHPVNNTGYPHSGSYAVFCENYLPNVNSDWLITPALQITQSDSLYFYTRAWFGTENLTVKVSTTGTSPANFNQTLVSLQGLGTAYQYRQVSLAPFAGQTIYIAFFWQCSTYGILVDDVKVGHPPLVQPVLNLPDSFTFIQGESLTVDFTPYITSTNINTASLSVSGNIHVGVQIVQRSVTFTCPGWSGSETLTFTLTDNSSALQTTDTVVINVNPIPTVDLGLVNIIFPRETEYVSHLVLPQVQIVNLGDNSYPPPIDIGCVIMNSQFQVVYNQTAVYTQTLPGDSVAAVSYSQGWMPLLEGTYHVQFTVSSMDQNLLNNELSADISVVIRQMTGGPDTFGYRWIDSNADGGPVYVWNDISATGQSAVMYNVTSFAGDDNFSEPVPLGFTFPFYGVDYTQCYIDINGELLLAPNTWYIPFPGTNWDGDGNMFNYMHPIPGYAQMPALIAPYWDDLYAEQGTGNVWFQSFGVSPNRYLIIQWDNLRYLAGTGTTSLLKFQAVLHENGEIYFYYHTAQTGQSGSNVPHNNGRSATVAIQNETANLGLCYLREIVQNNVYTGVEPYGNLLHDGLAIRFYAGADTQAPVITHTPPGNTFNPQPALTARIVDLSNIMNAELYYNFDGTWHNMPPSQSQSGNFTYVLPTLPAGSTLRYYFSAQDELGNSSQLPILAPIGVFTLKILPSSGTNVLLLYSGRQDYDHSELMIYQQHLNGQDVAYDIYNWEEYDSYRFPPSYDAIICYATTGISGAYSDTLSLALMEYLDGGTAQHPRHVFFASDGWAFGTGGSPNSSPEKKLLEAYFRTNYVATGTGGGTNGLAGPDVFNYVDGSLLVTSNSPIGTAGTELSVYANSPDCIFRYESCPDWYADEVQFPTIGATNALIFEDGPVNGQAYLYHGVCATSINLGIYKAFYFSFDFSQLDLPSQRDMFMNDLLTWFGILENSAPQQEIPSLQTALQSVSPNPFSQEVKITFSLHGSAPARLEIFNVKGQLVRTLHNGKLASGTHSLTWNGRDEADSPVGGGVYFCRLSQNGTTHTRKLLLVK